MPIIRNPFRKSPGDFYHNDENAVRVTDEDATAARKRDHTSIPKQSGFFNSLTSKPVKIPAQGTDKEPAEYQLCEINDSGVFLPPSPLERQSFWSSSRSTASRTSSYRSVSVWDETNEPFNMSRASFDSYRRSFDISARSPVTSFEPASSPRPQQSLDLRQVRYSFSASNTAFPSMPRLSPPRLPDMSQAPLRDNYFNPPASLEEDVDGESEESGDANAQEASRFDDVGLNDDKKPTKKRGFFSSHFGNSSAAAEPAAHAETTGRLTSTNAGAHSHSHSIGSIFSRKRGASGQGAELGRIRNQETTQPPADDNTTTTSSTPTPHSHQSPPGSATTTATATISASTAPNIATNNSTTTTSTIATSGSQAQQ